MVALFESAPLAVHLGMTLRYDDDLRGIIDQPHAGYLDHTLGQVLGGVFAALIDNAAWFTAADAEGRTTAGRLVAVGGGSLSVTGVPYE
jgi:hypothetical protein